MFLNKKPNEWIRAGENDFYLNNSMKKKLLRLEIIYGSIGVVMLFFAGYLYVREKKFEQNAYKTVGEVVDFETHNSSEGGSIMYAAKVRYVDRGTNYSCVSKSSSSSPDYQIGDKVEVLYEPNNPSKATIKGFLGQYLGVAILGAMGFISSLFGLIPLIINKRRNALNVFLSTNGRKIQAKNEGVSVNTSLSVNGRNPFLINAQYFDTVTNTVHIFQSENIWFDPTEFIKNKEGFDIIVDPNNYKKYNFEVSFLPKEG